MVIQTEFDGLLEEDIAFEETDQTLSTQDVLKNAENIIKATMYLRKLAGMSPIMNRLVKVSTVETQELTALYPDEDSNLILVKNLSSLNFTLEINDGELILLPFESFDFPLEGITKIRYAGTASIIETQFRSV